MAKHYQSPEAMCPFYRMEQRNAIHCEGVQPGVALMLISDDPVAEYKKSYCYGDWTRCKVARALWSIYDDPGNLRYMKNETANKSGLSGVAVKERHLWERFIESIKENRP